MARTDDWLTWSFSPSPYAILVTLAISLLLPILIHTYLYRESRALTKDPPTFLLVGPSNAGKTSLLTRFANGVAGATHTSQEVGSAVCELPADVAGGEDKYRSVNDTETRVRPKVMVVDTPGHGKLRHLALDQLTGLTSGSSSKAKQTKQKKVIAGVVFVVDSAAVASTGSLTETAEYLHDILLLLQKRHARENKGSKAARTVPVLVAANKQDVFTALPPQIIQARLEEAISKIRTTRSKGLLDSGMGMGDEGEDEEGSWLGEYGANVFQFAQMEEFGVDVSVRGGIVVGEGDGEGEGVREWWAWIGGSL